MADNDAPATPVPKARVTAPERPIRSSRASATGGTALTQPQVDNFTGDVPLKPLKPGRLSLAGRDPSLSLTPEQLALIRRKQKLGALIEGGYVQSVMMACLVIALFLVDIIDLMSADDSVDTGVNITLIVVFACFLMEMLVQLYAKPNYFLGFFFWMDLIGTASIVADIEWWAKGWLDYDGQSTTLRASRAAKIGARAGRVTRLIRLIRVLKVFRMYRRVVNKREESIAPTALAHSVSEAVSHQVAALVLITVLIMPLLTVPEIDTGPEAFKDSFMVVGNANMDSLITKYLDFFDGTSTTPVLLRINTTQVGYRLEDFSSFNGGFTARNDDHLTVGDLDNDGVQLEFDISEKNQEEAIMNILLVIFVVCELIAFSMMLNGTCNKLLVAPLERIFNLIQTNASMVMGALDLDEEEADEMNTIEAAIMKMTKLVQHVTHGANQGAHLLENALDSQGADAETRAWLMEYATNQQTGKGAGSRPSNLGAGDKVAIATSDENGDAPSGILVKRASDLDNDEQFAGGSNISSALLDSWDFDVWTAGTRADLCAYVHRMFADLGLFRAGLLTPAKLRAFLGEVQKLYRANSYHNFEHAIDVTHTTYRFMKLCDKRLKLSNAERFAMMVGALCHDMDHPGVNNAFLVNTKDQLATTYNDKSVLENRHIACLYNLIATNPEANIFSDIDDEQWREIRKIIISCVLHTDMVHHFAMVSQVEVFYELHSEAIRANTPPREDAESLYQSNEDRLFVLGLVLHSADISNAVKPFGICRKWADCVLGEFFSQGDKEREASMPVSPMMDRATTSRGLSQVNFIEFVVLPLYANVVKLFPELSMMIVNLVENRRMFGEMYCQEVDGSSKTPADQEEEKQKVRKRFDGLVEKYKLQRYQSGSQGALPVEESNATQSKRRGSVLSMFDRSGGVDERRASIRRISAAGTLPATQE